MPLNVIRCATANIMNDSVDIDVALVNTTGINQDGTSRQEILAECDERTLIFIAKNEVNGALGILVRRKEHADSKRSFIWVGEFPSEIVDAYRELLDTGHTFALAGYEFTRDGPTVGLRVRGRFVPPVVCPVGQEESFYDLTR
jgi:hypothetical protein